jgi:hypothetical protein
MVDDMKIKLADGKYTYYFDNGTQYATRYGKPWRDLVGDNLVYAMACEIEHLRGELRTVYDNLGKLGIDLDYLDMVDD